MMPQNWIPLVLSSAAIGALVSSLVTIVGQIFDRRSRRRELLLAKAIELAIHRNEFMVKTTKDMGTTVEAIYDSVQLAEVYYQWLVNLLDKGELPPGAQPIPGAERKTPSIKGVARRPDST